MGPRPFLFLFGCVLAIHLTAQDYPWQIPASPCIPADQDSQIWRKVREQEKQLHFLGNKRQATRFIWPLRFAEDTTLPGYYAIYQFVDHDPAYGQVLDYNCGHRTYDLEGYNHAGTDIGLYPWGWRKLDEGTIAVVAAASGVITGKDDGYYDRNCSWGNNPPANYVIVTHSDGSRAWYWHMKEGSVTSKPIGSTVETGEYLGKVASSGFSNIPHLHFEIRSANNDVIDPWAGSCNETVESSWWIDQRPYWDPAINEIAIHYEAPSPFSNCPDPEDTRIRRTYNPGSDFFPAAYYRDQRLGDPTNFLLIQPDGQVFTSWSHNSPSDYLTSWWYWQMKLPDNAMFGTWTYRIQYYEQVIDWTFEVSDACLSPLSLVVEKPGTKDAGLSWSAHAEKYLVQIYSGENLVIDTIVEQTSLKVADLNPDTKYVWSVTSICGADSSAATAGPAFSTRPIIYFQAYNLSTIPEQPFPSDSIHLTISGLLLNEHTQLQSLHLRQEKTDIFIEANWISSGEKSLEKDSTITLVLPPLDEGEYKIYLSGEHGDYTFLYQGYYSLYVSGCKEIPLYLSPLSNQSVLWEIDDQAGLGQYILRYRLTNEKEFNYDTLVFPYCLYPPCPGFGTKNLEYRLGQWLIRNLQPCEIYEFALYQPCINGEGDFSKPQRIQLPCEALPCANLFNPVLDSVTWNGFSMHWQDSLRPSNNAYVVNVLEKDSVVWQDFLYTTPNNRHYRDHHVFGRYRVDCLCKDGFCLRPPLILPAPTFYTLTGLTPCTSYRATVSQWCLDTLLPATDTIAFTTSCPTDPYFNAVNSIQIYEPQAAGLDSLEIQGQPFSFDCGDCSGCNTTGFQLIPDTLNVTEAINIAWWAWLPGSNRYVDNYTGQENSFGPGRIALYLDADSDGNFETLLYQETVKDRSGVLNAGLGTDLAPGHYRLRLVWSPLEEPVAHGFLHFGSVIDIPIHWATTTSREENSLFDSISFINPVSKEILLMHLPDRNVQVSVFNLLGQRMEVPLWSDHQSTIALDVTSYPDGVYFIQLATGQDNRVITLVKLN
ncbi:MAG: peptidoglycan DD-metalloendopeptidase family protein [Lewinellaceae bacterium]|nr:peptidoglycan DD-metalloendopeptidase family protein [Lewinellaceae bacterium]